MSELKLSARLVGDLQKMLVAHDETAEDPGIASQYLCAVVGFLLGQQEMPDEQKDEALEQLAAFMQHVANDVSQQRRQAPPHPPPPPPPQEAFGIWKPKS